MRRRWHRTDRVLLAALGAVVAVGATIVPAGAVSAHTDFESSTPADGAVVEGPVAEITIAFTAAAERTGDGFVVLDPSGAPREPTSVKVADGRVFTLGFDPPLGAGTVGVRWSVQAGDAHPIDGSFSFTITAPTPTAPPAAPPAPPVPEPPPTSSGAPPISTTATPDTAADTTTPSTTTDTAAAATTTDTGDTALDEFLAGGAKPTGQARQLVGRVVGFVALLAAIGALAFVAMTLRGSSTEIATALGAIAALGIGAALGSALEYWGTAAQRGDSFTAAWSSTPGSAMALRVVGGLALAVGALVARTTLPLLTDRHRWDVRAAPLALVGTGLAVASFWFDGHTVSRGPRLVHIAVDTVHVAAAAVWAGGVITLATTLWSRHRRREESGATELVVRFSTIATVALVAVGAAGVAMTSMIIDSPGDLTATEWGRVYLVKTGAVAFVALIGAYNHFRLRPALERSSDDTRAAATIRSTLVAEAIVVVFVISVTARLVAASPA